MADKRAAETRTAFDEKTKSFNLNKKKVTNYKKNSCPSRKVQRRRVNLRW